MGGIEWQQRQTQHIYIQVVTKYFTLITLTTVLHPDPGNSPATRNAKYKYFYQIIYLYYESLY